MLEVTDLENRQSDHAHHHAVKSFLQLEIQEWMIGSGAPVPGRCRYVSEELRDCKHQSHGHGS